MLLQSGSAPLLGVGHPRWAHPTSARRRRVVGLAGLLRARPRLGHARCQHEVLAQRVALEAVGQEQRVESVVSGERRCRTSRASHARASPPRHTPRTRTGRPRRRAAHACGCSTESTWPTAGDARCMTTEKPSSSSSTPVRKSKKPHPRVSRAVRAASTQPSTGTSTVGGPKPGSTSTSKAVGEPLEPAGLGRHELGLRSIGRVSRDTSDALCARGRRGVALGERLARRSCPGA